MGNNQPRYYNEKEAVDIIGKHTAERLYQQLNQNGKYLDYHLFSQIISNQFDRIPKVLCECIFYGFSSDLLGKVDIRLFISALAAIIGEPDQSPLLKFLFRVYSAPGSYELERIRVEKILVLAYGTTLEKGAALKEVETLFNGQTYLPQKEFEIYPHPLPIMSGWIKAVLTIFIEDLPPRLASLDRRYSAALESEQMMARYGVPKSTCDQLRQVYYAKCSSNGSTKGELTEECWIDWTSRFLPCTLARIIYRAKLDPPLKTVWRFVDFAEYCMIFGRSTQEDIASTLCVAFQQQSHVIEIPESDDCCVEGDQDNEKSDHQEKKQRYTPLVSILEMRRLLYLLSLPNASYDIDESSQMQISKSPPLSVQTSDDVELHSLHNRYGEYLNPLVLRALSNIESNQNDGSADISLQSYVDLICNNSSCFPGLLWLSITACCVFGLKPASPVAEKEYITELMLWKEAETKQSSKQPYGQIGTEWCIISSEWWLKWSYFVGRSNRDEPVPPPIDNWILLKKSSAVKSLIPNLSLGTDFEIVFPEVFHAFQAWYGGGPKVIRKVIPSLPPSNGPEDVTSHLDTKPVVEFYPISIRLFYCDENGKFAENPMTFEQMWSKYAKIEDIVAEICLSKGYMDQKTIHLWNIENKNWKNHFILANELTLQQAGIVDGQMLLIERQLSNGIWPKSQLHSQLETDESKLNPSSNSSDSPIPGAKSAGQLVTSHQINNGRVGLDNLGNTCYMNASLQALLHTNFLNEYFLTKLYLRDINKNNKHGYGGRLAVAYSALVNDLWRSRQSDQIMGHAIAVMTDAMNAVTTSSNSPTKAQIQNSNGFVVGPSSVNPRKFRKEVGAIRDQFAGDDQHDAQELLAFLLDGLSEDLNLIQVKPYIEQPDSDDRPDHILADIWWDNHLQRDFSAIQSIFTGQFKSITTCKKCEYNSARYEPFNMLSVPLPEESMRSLVVYLLTLTGRFYCCSVRVPKGGTLTDVAHGIKTYNLDGVDENSLFIPVLMVNYKIVNILSLLKSLDTIRDNDFLLFYQVKELPLTRSLPVVVSRDNLEQTEKPKVGSGGRYGKITPTSNTTTHTNMESSQKNLEQTAPVEPSAESQSSEMEKEISYDGDSDSGEDTQMDLVSDEQNGLGDDFMRDVEGEIVGDTLKPENVPSKQEDTIEVIFIHRRVKFITIGGIEMFKMEQVGLPILEVLPVRTPAVKVYSLISQRVSSHLKSSITELAKSNLLSVNVVSSPTQPHSTKSKKSSTTPQTKNSDSGTQLPRNHSNLSVRSDSHGPSRIRPIATQDAIGGDIPPYGYVLPNGEFCSRCHWLNRCEGCIIPYDDEETLLTLDDGVTIAIDWHYVVYQEILDLQKSSEVIQHSSMKDHQSFHSKELPLEKCLQKFTEEEPLDDMICPKCRNDNCLKRSFALWRLPPVLIIQLKRFQFNNYSRRKLTNFVNFPLEGLDMTEFLAPTARFLYSNTEDEIETSDKSTKIGTLYDLYSAVYHVGALGGGHYIATARDMSEHLSNILASYDESSPSNHPSTGKSPSISPTSPSSPKSPSSGQWWCYNDSTVTPITSDKDIVSSSAYVLFYIRKDIQYSRFQDIHSIPASIMEVVNQQRSLTPETPMSSSDQEEKSARTLIGESMNEAKNTLTKLIPPSIATSRATVDSPTHQNSDPSTSAQSDNQETCTLS